MMLETLHRKQSSACKEGYYKIKDVRNKRTEETVEINMNGGASAAIIFELWLFEAVVPHEQHREAVLSCIYVFNWLIQGVRVQEY